MKNISARISVLFYLVILAISVILTGCGGGGGSTSSSTGSLEGYVLVPIGSQALSAGTFVALSKDGAPAGYEPLASASVQATIGQKSYSAVTGADGHFLISEVQCGRVTVRILPPANSFYLNFTTTIDVTSGTPAQIGQGGQVSLLSGNAHSLSTTINSVDTKNWPSVILHVTVLDPTTNAVVMGMTAGNFNLQTNGPGVNITGVSTEMTTGANPYRVYVVSTIMSGSKPDCLRAELSSTYSGRTGSAAMSVGNLSKFSPAVSSTQVLRAFKDPNYATLYPGKWHEGVDISASVGTRVNAVSKGKVIAILLADQDTGVVVKHRLPAPFNTAGGPTQDIYVLYGCVNPSVAVQDVVETGQMIGTIRSHSNGTHLHLAVRIGDTITTAWGLGTLVGGSIPAADAYGLTDGWIDPVSFFATKTPDNDWDPTKSAL